MGTVTMQELQSSTQELGQQEKTLHEIQSELDAIWQYLSAREKLCSGNTISLPYHTLRYIDEVEKAFELTYCICPVNQAQKSLLKQIEIECHALEAAINARELSVHAHEMRDAKSIFVALRVLFKEFKEDRMGDGDIRLNAFVQQLKKLMFELLVIFKPPQI